MNGHESSRISRRDLARWAALGAGAAPLLRAGRSGARTVPAPVVPAQAPWWLRDNFAPVTDEVEVLDLPVIGALPPELTGTYVRNGSNPARANSQHWFFGDGMVHGLRLEAGRARWYRNRYVRTAMFDAGADFGQGPPGGASNQSNVSAVWHGGRLLTSGEVGLPYHLDPATLDTIGPLDFGGRLTTSFTAHPKIDPATGRMHVFGYGFVPPYLTYYVVESDGALSHLQEVPIPASTMIHDFAITEQYAVFWDLPVVFDLAAATAFINDPSVGAFPYQWRPDAGARLGLVPLGGGQARWFDIDPCYVFHGVNAYEDGGRVVVDVCRLSSMFDGPQILGGQLSLRRWTVDPATSTVTDEVLDEDRPGELPTRDPRLVGRKHRYGYLVENRPSVTTVDLGGVIKYDFATGRRTVWDPGPSSHTGEWLFVPTDPGEDEGFLLGFVHDATTASTDFAVLDATDVAAGPVARVRLPQRVPYGFHGTWIPE